jgi:hypothetical protein
VVSYSLLESKLDLPKLVKLEERVVLESEEWLDQFLSKDMLIRLIKTFMSAARLEKNGKDPVLQREVQEQVMHVFRAFVNRERGLDHLIDDDHQRYMRKHQQAGAVAASASASPFGESIAAMDYGCGYAESLHPVHALSQLAFTSGIEGVVQTVCEMLTALALYSTDGLLLVSTALLARL